MYNLDKLEVNFLDCPKGTKLIDHFKQIGCFEEFVKTKDENIIKLSILTADPESPFIKIKDRKTMLNEIFSFLKISKTDKLFNDIIEYTHQQYLDCFGRYLTIVHDYDWIEYQTMKQTHDVLTLESMRTKQTDETIDDFVKRKVNAQKHLKLIGEQLKEIESKIFPDSRAAKIIALNQKTKIITYAEKYAEDNTYK